MAVIGEKHYIQIDIEPINTEGKVMQTWESFFEDPMSPFYGYKKDIEDSSIDEVLKQIFNLQNNLFEVKDTYSIHIENLKSTCVEGNKDSRQELDKELDTLDFEKNFSMSDDIVKIMKKYGILPLSNISIPYEKLTHDYAIIMGEDRAEKYSNNLLKTREEEKSIDYTPTYLSGTEKFYGVNDKTIYTELNLALEILVFSKQQNRFLDFTSFITSINTSVAVSSGGNFSFKLAFNNKNSVLEGANVINSYVEGSISQDGYIKALRLQNLLKENDVVFIKFEKLKVEKEENLHPLKGKYWDMIGLIDQTELISDYKSYTLNVIGRDLIKLLIEDNSIFIPYLFSNDSKTTFGGKTGGIFKRLFATGEYQLQFIYSLRNLENSVGFIISQLTNIEILDEEALKLFQNEYGEDWGKEFIYDQSGKNLKAEKIKGIWGMMEYRVAGDLKHYKLADTSINTPDGSIYQQIKKLCQFPLVELLCDTYKNKYDIILRRPPLTPEVIKESATNIIDSALLISDNLAFDREIYTVFKYTPLRTSIGGSNSIPLSLCPMIVLDKYCKIFGNRYYELTSPYMDMNVFGETTEDAKLAKETFIEDLIWILKYYAIKPFTRCGTITLRGDRRIKAGSFVFLQKTNEIFYVDAVAQSAQIIENQIQRVTTLNVSRGMVKDYLFQNYPSFVGASGHGVEVFGKDIYSFSEKQNVLESDSHLGSFDALYDSPNGGFYQDFKISYFNLIDEKYLRESLKNNLIYVEKAYSLKKLDEKNGEIQRDPNTLEFSSTDSIVVEGVFNFFLKGMQFEERKDNKDSADSSKGYK